MNKIFNYCAMLLFSAVALVMGSCTEEYEYDPAAAAAGAQVYFNSGLAPTVNLTNEGSFTVPINRVNADEAITVNLSLTDESGIYSIPQSVSFAEGEKEQNITVNYDPKSLEYDNFTELTIGIADADYTTPYGSSSYTFSVGIPSPYESVGTGTFADNYLVSGYAEVEIMQNKLNPKMFRIMHPYDEIAEFLGGEGFNVSECPEYLEVTVMSPGDQLSGVTITQQDLVYFSPVSVGVDIFELGYPAQIWHPSHFGGASATEAAWVHNRVNAWQDNGLPGEIQLAPFYFIPETSQGSNQSSVDNLIVITFPGYEKTDYSVNVNYTGAFVSADEESFAVGKVELGEDVAEAKVAVVEGTNPDNALAMVMGGAVETVSLTKGGEVKVPCNYSGDCTMIAVAYDAEGNLQNYGYDTFNFALTPGEWKSIGNGLYTDYAFAPFFLSDGQGNVAPAPTYSVQVQENTNTPGVYRVINPYHPDNYYYQIQGGYGYDESNDYNIVIDAHDPDAVFIQAQSLGIDGGYADAAQTKPFGQLTLLTVGGNYIDGGYSFEEVKAAGKINGVLRDGVVTFAPKELLMGGTLIDDAFYLGFDDPTSQTPNFLPTNVLVLPDAVTAGAKAKAVNAPKTARFFRKNNVKASKSVRTHRQMFKSGRITDVFSNYVKFVR